MNFAQIMQQLADKGVAHRDLVKLRTRAIGLARNRHNQVTVDGVALVYYWCITDGESAHDIDCMTDTALLKLARLANKELLSGSLS